MSVNSGTREEPIDTFVEEVVKVFISRSREDFEHRMANWPHDRKFGDFHEVLGALLARQVTLAVQLARCPHTWNGHLAPLILRSMADVYINIAWILAEPSARCKEFIQYGLGQQKLELEHRRAEMDSRESEAEEQDYIEAVETWLNSQRATFLTDVDLGAWSGLSTRQMAEEAGCLDFYNYVYTPFSACVHSMWHHVGRYNLRQCQNPLHGYHHIPLLGPQEIDIYYLYLAAKYLHKALKAVDRSLGIEASHDSAFKQLCDELDNLARQVPPAQQA